MYQARIMDNEPTISHLNSPMWRFKGVVRRLQLKRKAQAEEKARRLSKLKSRSNLRSAMHHYKK